MVRKSFQRNAAGYPMGICSGSTCPFWMDWDLPAQMPIVLNGLSDGSKDQEYALLSSFVPKALLNITAILRLVETSF